MKYRITLSNGQTFYFVSEDEKMVLIQLEMENATSKYAIVEDFAGNEALVKLEAIMSVEHCSGFTKQTSVTVDREGAKKPAPIMPSAINLTGTKIATFDPNTAKANSEHIEEISKEIAKINRETMQAIKKREAFFTGA